jgi:hypothetical protein
MSRIALIAGLLIISFVKANAQANISYESLQLTSSPAYVILGVDPENIQRPGSPTEFVAGAQSAVVNGQLQPNFALETSPYYWGKRRADSSGFSPLGFLLSGNWGDNLLRSITFAAATSATDTVTFGGLRQGTGIGLGVHMQLFHGHISSKSYRYLQTMFKATNVASLLEMLREKLEVAGTVPNVRRFLTGNINAKTDEEYLKGIRFAGAMTEVMELIGKNRLEAADSTLIRQLIEEQDDQVDQGSEQFHSLRLPLTREGFMMELSAASGCVAGDSRWDRVNLARTAIWLTPSYRFNTARDSSVIDFIDVMAVARLTINSRDIEVGDYFDAGLKLQWIHNRFSIAGEGIYRYATALAEETRLKYTYRADVSIGYKINDNITFKATFGTNFDGNTVTYSDPKKMFAVGGFNFGFGNLFR